MVEFKNINYDLIDVFSDDDINFSSHFPAFPYHENDSFFEIKSFGNGHFSAAPEQFPAAENSFETLQNDLLFRTDFLASLRNLTALGRFVSFCREDPGAAGIPIVSVRIFADILADVKRKFLKKYGLSEAAFSDFFNS